MTSLEHIAVLKKALEHPAVFGELLDDFAEEHHNGIEDYIETEWADMLEATTTYQRRAALLKLEGQYQRLNFLKKGKK